MTTAAHSALEDASDVTHSTAYNALNALVDEGTIVEERADYLKQKFKDLHSRVLTIYRRDNLLLKRARQLRTELDRERERVHACGEVARKDDDEIQKQKRILMSLEKDLSEAQERESILQVETLEYDRRKQNLILEREDAQAAEEARLRPKLEAVQAEITEMGLRVKVLVDKYEELKGVQEKLIEAENNCKTEITNFTSTLAQARQLYSNVEHDPERALKQLQLVSRSLAATQNELQATEEKLVAEQEVIRQLEVQRDNRANDAANTATALQKIRSDIESKRKTLATLNTSLEVEMETKQSYQERIAELDQLLKATHASQKQEVDSIDRVLREKERCVREFSSLTQAREDLVHEQNALKDQLNLANKSIEKTEKRHAEIKSQVEECRKKITAETKQLLKEQSKEKDFTKKANIILEDLTDVTDMITAKARQEDIKERELASLMCKRQELSREVAREASRVLLTKHELNNKDSQLREVRHRHSQLETRFRGLIENFQKIKRERGQKAAHIQAITQKMTEVAEKARILENELEVLVREAALKEKEYLRKKRQAHELQLSCVNMRLEKNRCRKLLEKAHQSEKAVRAQVRRVNMDVASVEDTMTALRDTYTNAVENRNQTGIQLIDRNDELSLLIEKVKEQEAALQHGVSLTNMRSEEVKSLKIRLSDLLRDITVCQKSLPKVKQMEDELSRIVEDIDDERWRTSVLENELTDPNNPYSWRHIKKVPDSSAAKPLPGPVAAATEEENPATSTTVGAGSGEAAAGAGGAGGASTAAASPVPNLSSNGPTEEYVRLQARTQDLENRVNLINQKLREKELILAEVRELSARIGAQANTGKQFTLALAKQVNQYQSGIRQKTRQMMATISELSLFQASSIQFQQEVERLEEVVTEAERRLESGEAPFAEAEEEYEKEKTSNARYAEILRGHREQKHAAAELGADVIATTCEPRPNAYIPNDGLGLPKPYGALAPFKPSFAPTIAVTALRDRTVRKSGGRSAKADASSAVSGRSTSVAQSADFSDLLHAHSDRSVPSKPPSEQQVRLSERSLSSTH